jgi:hypothetical protein
MIEPLISVESYGIASGVQSCSEIRTRMEATARNKSAIAVCVGAPPMRTRHRLGGGQRRGRAADQCSAPCATATTWLVREAAGAVSVL